ncbi:MAG: DUF1552 domain-containing protein [Planctomycetales bacterium]|nr:DUF1552 domain-containing protein [Planctomycetales bacterium]
MIESRRINRRTVLKGLGTAVALPMLDVMRPLAAAASEASATAAPVRAAFIYVPNGMQMSAWTPATEGGDFVLPYILEPLAKVREKFCVLSGLAHDKARANGDGGGDHARSAATFLTACQAYKTDGADIHVGRSVDQIAAAEIGAATRFASIEVGCDKGAQSGNCDTGYSCAYSSNLSWRTESMPLAKEVDPRLIFDRLFGNDAAPELAEVRVRRDRDRRSILDFVLGDAQRLSKQLGRNDRRKLDEYLGSIRDVETRIGRYETLAAEDRPELARPSGIPEDYAEHLRIIGDLLVLAFQGDLTRVGTFMFANAGSNRAYPQIDVPEGHHSLSHHGGDEEKQRKISEINRFHATQLAYLLERLDSVAEGDGTLLDNSMIVYGSGIGDGNRHNHDDLPVLLAGRGGGTIASGRHIRYADQTPMANLYVALLERMGVAAETLGDSTGRLDGLQG